MWYNLNKIKIIMSKYKAFQEKKYIQNILKIKLLNNTLKYLKMKV